MITVDLKNAQELDPKKCYFVQVDTKDLPAEQVQQVVTKIKEELKTHNIEKVIYMPVRHGKGAITIEARTMSDKTLKQYIREKFSLKVKRVGSKWYTLSYDGGIGDSYWCMTAPWDDYGYLVSNRLFDSLSELADVLNAAKGKTHESK